MSAPEADRRRLIEQAQRVSEAGARGRKLLIEGILRRRELLVAFSDDSAFDCCPRQRDT